jgi:hypothetical protein
MKTLGRSRRLYRAGLECGEGRAPSPSSIAGGDGLPNWPPISRKGRRAVIAASGSPSPRGRGRKTGKVGAAMQAPVVGQREGGRSGWSGLSKPQPSRLIGPWRRPGAGCSRGGEVGGERASEAGPSPRGRGWRAGCKRRKGWAGSGVGLERR